MSVEKTICVGREANSKAASFILRRARLFMQYLSMDFEQPIQLSDFSRIDF